MKDTPVLLAMRLLARLLNKIEMVGSEKQKSRNACGNAARVLRNELEKLIPMIPSYPFRETDPSGIVEEFIAKKPKATQLDVELASLFTAMISWGNRKAIRTTARRLVFYEMKYAPQKYILGELYKNPSTVFQGCVYRTLDYSHFQEVCENVRQGLKGKKTIEEALKGKTIEEALSTLCEWLAPAKIGSPGKSVCKRMSMFLRWMVRREYPDFNVWKSFSPSNLFAIMDVHVNRLTSEMRECKTATWNGCVELTNIFKSWDAKDPLKYDIALMMYADKALGV
ncbi:MAG: DUF2400 family protein [Kiritimatiellae bacterium]|nr:DUF2400 family protein [Kiritimatiellia bacterium]